MHENTQHGTDRLFDFEDQGAITQAREGMSVVDSAGQNIGTVERVQMANPDAATTAGTTVSPDERLTAFIGSLFGAGFEIPEAKMRQLLRYGFIKVDGPGLGDMDRFVRADRIARVSGDTVYLTLSREQLPSAE